MSEQDRNEKNSSNVVELLENLASIFESGDITDEEYQKAKSLLLTTTNIQADALLPKLSKLIVLYDNGNLSNDEFIQAKARLLNIPFGTKSEINTDEKTKTTSISETPDTPQLPTQNAFFRLFVGKVSTSDLFNLPMYQLEKKSIQYRRHRFVNVLVFLPIILFVFLLELITINSFANARSYSINIQSGRFFIALGFIVVLFCFFPIRGFLRTNFLLQTTRILLGKDPMKGLATNIIYVGIGGFIVLEFIALIAFFSGTSNIASIEANALSTSVAIEQTQSYESANKTATAVLWTATFTSTPTMTLTPTTTVTSSPTPTQTLTPTLTSTNIPSPTALIAQSSGNNINARVCPSQSCEVTRVVSTNDTFTIIGLYNDWYGIIFEDGNIAYISASLVNIPADAVIPLGPTLTPTATASNTPLPTRTPRPTSTPRPSDTPIKFDEEMLLTLITITMSSNDYPINSIDVIANRIIVEIPDSSTLEEDELINHRFSYAGLLVGAIVAAYENEDSIATAPQTIVIRYTYSGILTLEASFSFRNASMFVNGDLTPVEFFETWSVR